MAVSMNDSSLIEYIRQSVPALSPSTDSGHKRKALPAETAMWILPCSHAIRFLTYAGLS